MKLLRHLFIAVICAFQAMPALAWPVHGIPQSALAKSEFVPNFLGSGEYVLLNMFQESATTWNYNNNTGKLNPDELDANGTPMAGANWSTQTGAKTFMAVPNQAQRPGHYVAIWTGSGKFSFGYNGVTTTGVSCIGTASTVASTPACSNTACSTFTGSIASTTLTVTAAPTGIGCTLGAGVPISGSGVLVSTFGTPTIITSAGSACGPNTCYTVNQSQTVGSETLNIGGRLEVSFADGIPVTNGLQTLVFADLTTTINQPANFAVFHVNDESNYWASATPCGKGTACLIGSTNGSDGDSGMFRQRVKQANFASIRDLNWTQANVGPCNTWSTRKPATYLSYNLSELRNAASGAGQYVNASGSGASAGTVSYNAGSDTYSITLGSGNFADKQTILVLIPTTGTTASKVSLNGNAAVPFRTPGGGAIGASTIPTAATVYTLVYDAVLGGVLEFSGGLNCGMPPEAFVEIAAELNLQPWHVLPYLALDPMTDWVQQYAAYLKANYYGRKPIIEVSNEPFNCISVNAQYMSAKSAKYVAEDGAWTTGLECSNAPTGNNYAEIGKMASTVGQDLTSVLGTGAFEMAIPIQTGNSSTANQVLQSTSYINQTIAPTQGGYTQTAALTFATRISVNNYWNTGWYGLNGSSIKGLEVGVAYCYFNYSISAPCQSLYASQAAAMTTYMNTSTTSSLATNNIASLVGLLATSNTWASTCSQGVRPGNCTLNQTAPLLMYEGGYSPGAQTADVTQSFTSATNANPAVLTITNNGCVQGQTIALSGLSGGTWSTAAGSYTVQSGPTTNTCTINLDSTGLGTLAGATITYTGSAGYVTFLRVGSYLAPELNTLTNTVYTDVLANGAVNPSQFNLAASGSFNSNGQWLVFGFDIYGDYIMGKCTSCTISTTTLTLGGTITGQFRNGDSLFGKGVTGVGNGAGANTVLSGCSTVGSGPCGTNSGDTFTLSNSSTVAGGETMTGNAIPSGSACSPITAWKAISSWNSGIGC